MPIDNPGSIHESIVHKSSNQSSNQNRNDNLRSLAMVRSRAVVGVNAMPVMVEVHLANGLPAFSTVGLPETAVKESKDRVRSAIINSGFEFPAKRITVNLAPADLPKNGGRFDLPIAIGILLASGQLKGADVSNLELVGELALNGELRKVSGVLPTAIACGETKASLVVPTPNAGEASLASSTQVLHAGHLLHVCSQLLGQGDLALCEPQLDQANIKHECPDLADVKGQQQAKRAIEISAAGGHSMIFIGPPGAGKTMLASRLIGLLPELSETQALETAAVQSIALGEFDIADWKKRPFRSPHHSSSPAALVGGGSTPKPGEISKAHNGVLFLDELTEFSRATLEQLREPLETGKINIARATQSVSYPARFMLIAACNPCKCGFFGDGTDRCKCSQQSVNQYMAKLSGPMLDRIDMHVHLPRVPLTQLQSSCSDEENSAFIKAKVIKCRAQQHKLRGKLNSQLQSQELDKHCSISPSLCDFLTKVCDKLNMSARAYHRVLKLARTIADLDQVDDIQKHHLAEAIGFRSLDRG